MAITLFEDSYITLTEAFSIVGYDTAWTSVTLEKQEEVLKAATQTLDNSPWAGSAVSPTQSLAWPRQAFSFYDPNYNMIIEVSPSSVPRKLKQAVALLALHYIKYPEAREGYHTSYDSISVGPISISNNDASTPGRIPRVPSTVSLLIGPLLVSGANSFNWWRAN